LAHDSPNILWIGPEAGNLPACWTVGSSLDAFDAAVISAPVLNRTVEELVEDLSRGRANAPVLVYDPTATVADAIRYVRLGAHDVVKEESGLIAMVEAVIELRRGQREAEAGIERWRKLLVGSSAAMLRTVEVIRLVGGRRSTVLITGETGTGKEMVARAIHLASPRAHLPMVTVNCNALPETLLEAELFGHVKGAFTGAIQQRVGRFEQANRGTLFLDEIGDLPLDTQTKLLRVLQEREFQRVGSSETVRVDVRLIAATHVDLAERIKQGKFREDLYYRLNVVPITTPPLRHRLEDIPALACHFLGKICRQEEIPLRRLDPETLDRLSAYSWPGNVRQLENAVERAVALSGEREVLYASDFALSTTTRTVSAPIAVPDTGLDFERTVGGIERQILQQALQRAGGNKTAAAEMLGLKRTTLAAKLKSLEAVAT